MPEDETEAYTCSNHASILKRLMILIRFKKAISFYLCLVLAMTPVPRRVLDTELTKADAPYVNVEKPEIIGEVCIIFHQAEIPEKLKYKQSNNQTKYTNKDDCDEYQKKNSLDHIRIDEKACANS